MAAPMLPSAPVTDLLPIIPELVLIASAFALLILDVFLDARRRVLTHGLTLVVLAVAFVLLVTHAGWEAAEPTMAFNGMFVRDQLADTVKAVIVLVSGLSLVYGWPYLRERNLYPGEFPVLVLFATVGMMMLASAGSLVMVYLGLELLSLCSYALVGMNRDSGLATEAAIKYFVLGSIASGLLLYGMSLVYGVTGSLSLSQINAAIAGITDRPMLLTGMVFMVCGIAFKLGAAPFHMWLPDVYQGAPTPITLFVSAGPKLAAFVMAYRVLAQGLGPTAPQWQLLFAVLAALSLIIGNVVAVAQSNLKRMLAYSTLSHIGFLLLGLAGGGPEGYAAALFYGITYALMSAASFGAILVLSRQGFEAEMIDDFKGLGARSPWMAGLVLCVMASLAGVPPFLGFWAKLVVLRAALDGELMWLALLAVICAVIGAFYYLRVVKVMYFDEPVGAWSAPRPGKVVPLVFGVNALGLLALGFAWNPLMNWCRVAFGA
jgi:NADH-quinone oxidoreductase subunit N